MKKHTNSADFIESCWAYLKKSLVQLTLHIAGYPNAHGVDKIVAHFSIQFPAAFGTPFM